MEKTSILCQRIRFCSHHISQKMTSKTKCVFSATPNALFEKFLLVKVSTHIYVTNAGIAVGIGHVVASIESNTFLKRLSWC